MRRTRRHPTGCGAAALQAMLLSAAILLAGGLAYGAAATARPNAPHHVDRLAARGLLRSLVPAADDLDRGFGDDVAARRWSAAHPRWDAWWNPRAAAPHRAMGPGIPLDRTPHRRDEVEAACRAFLAGLPWLDGEAATLRAMQVRRRGGTWYVTFAQTAGGRRILGSRVDVRVTRDGRVTLFGIDRWNAPASAAPAKVSGVRALATALADLPGTVEDVSREEVVLPGWHDPGPFTIAAHEIRLRTRQPADTWYCLVDASSGELLLRESRSRTLEISGRLSAQIEPVTAGDSLETLPVRDTRVNIGSGLVEFGYTDPAGDFRVATARAGSVDVFVRLAGRYGRIFNDAAGRVTPRVDLRMLPGFPRDVAWDASNSRANERDAYVHALRGHTYIVQLDPSFTETDYVMPIVVEILGGQCNAWYDGFGINFYAAGDRCIDAARIADVVLHEYGHAVTDGLYRPFAPSGAMHEAFSDYFAATITGDPEIGRGLLGPGTALRSVDNTLRAPDDLTGQVHADGLILAGALWDLRRALGPALADSLFHFARYGLAETFDDYLLDVLATDDDNADVFDGTPHLEAIADAFEPHGIGDYDVHVLHEPLADTEDSSRLHTVRAELRALFALDTTQVRLHYTLDDATWMTRSLQPAAAPHTYEATLPAVASGQSVAYWIEAADVRGHRTTSPPGAPAATWEFHVGPDTLAPRITWTPLEDRPQNGPDWPLRATVADNLDQGLARVEFRWSANDTLLDRVVELVDLGDGAWGGTLPHAGLTVGDRIHYALVATDAAAVANVTRDPASGSRSFAVVRGTWYDFEADGGGFQGDGDWEWGVPTTGPVAAPSGTRVWGTFLGGAYAGDLVSDLVLGPVDLGGWARAALVFQHWLDSEPVFDGGRVEISRDGGQTWTPLEPDGGYPAATVDALGGPGYSGSQPRWETAAFDLSRYRGDVVSLRWRFAADATLSDHGWFVDDVEVVERQIRARPLELLAEDGHDRAVPLRWRPPAGIDPAAPDTPLRGYRVYRGTPPDLTDATLVSTGSPTQTAYRDTSLQNGRRYAYAVTAAYDEGESAWSNVVEAQPFRAVAAIDTAALYVESNGQAAVDTVLALANAGTGVLKVNVWLGDSDDRSLDDVRIRFDTQVALPAQGVPAAAARGGPRKVASSATRPGRGGRPQAAVAPPPAAAYRLLHTDASEPGALPDLHRLLAATAGDTLFLKLDAYAPWTDGVTAFTVIVGLDTDGNRASGDPQGRDAFVVLGALALQQLGVPAYVATVQQEILGLPPHLHFPPNADSLEVGFPLDWIGRPGSLLLDVTAWNPGVTQLRDRAPNVRFAATWLAPHALHLDVAAGTPEALRLDFSTHLPPGTYGANLLLETNDPTAPEVVVPVIFRWGITPVTLFDLRAYPEGRAVVLTWGTHVEGAAGRLRVLRAAGEGAFVRLFPDLAPEASGRYTFRDPDPPTGRLRYRIVEVDASSGVTVLGETSLEVAGVAPPVAFLAAAGPNPFNPRTTLRYGVARAGRVRLTVYDVRGRRVRALVDAVRPPGYYDAVWAGRDDHGRRVASGVYAVVLETGGRRLQQRLTLLK